MPGRDLERYHTQFIKDKNRERDRDHSRAVDFGENLAKTLDHATLVDRDEDPDKEGSI
jgi:hypothetical protein